MPRNLSILVTGGLASPFFGGMAAVLRAMGLYRVHQGNVIHAVKVEC